MKADLNKVRELLRQSAHTQSELAQIIGISGNTLKTYLYGRQAMSNSVLTKIADLFGVAPESLMLPDDPESVRKPSPDCGRIFCPHCHQPIIVSLDAVKPIDDME